MNREELSELAAGYALGSLDGDDRERFEALLRAGDAEAVTLLREFQDTVVGLAQDVRETPPPAVKAALMDRVAAARPVRAGAVVPRLSDLPRVSEPRRRPSLWVALSAAAMAAGIAAIVVGLVVSAGYERRLQMLAQEAAAVRRELDAQQAVVGILRDPATQVVSLAGQSPSPEARGRMLWHTTGGGLFVSAGLPQAPAGKTYQLWAIVGKEAPIPAGTFSVDARGVGSLRVSPLPGVSHVDVFAVTLEPAGGRPAPTGEMYLVGKA